ncbi:MAG: ornithine cyclodeaminase [Gracilibacteraceae bacterium]|jgi:ornithine cyclodeaminase|nr:ornithine cyclodeaminase [Gracilibacteraceae bacterium]
MSSPRIDFLYLSEPDMIKAGVTDMKACVEAIEEMFRLMKLGDYRMAGANGNSHGAMVNFPAESEFPNMPTDGPDRRFMAMPAYLGGRFDMAGMKWYGSNVENRKKGLPRSILMLVLNDKDTGAPVAFMSANLLSAYRTGAVPGVGFKYFAPENAKTAGIIGPGVMSRTAFDAIMTTRPSVTSLKIKGSSPESLSVKQFVKYVRANYPTVTDITVVNTYEEAVRDSDIVEIATSGPMGNPSTYPYIDEKWIKPGAIVACPAAARFDDDFIINRARNVADNVMLYEAWHDEFYFPESPAYNVIPIPAVHMEALIHEGKMKKERLDDLGDVLVGKVPVHRNENEITIYSVGGMPTEDVAWGTVVYRNALKLGLGTKLNLWDKPELA